MLVTISTLISKIKAAYVAKAYFLDVGYSDITRKFVLKLIEEGFVSTCEVFEYDSQKVLRIGLLPNSGFVGVVMGSTPGFRVFLSLYRLRKLKQRVPSATVLLSTKYGFLTSSEALRRNVGGLLICLIY